MPGTMEEAKTPIEKPLASVDYQAWVKAAVFSAMHMAIDLHNRPKVGADARLISEGLRGIAEGAMQEILFTLGYQLEHASLCPDLQAHQGHPLAQQLVQH